MGRCLRGSSYGFFFSMTPIPYAADLRMSARGLEECALTRSHWRTNFGSHEPTAQKTPGTVLCIFLLSFHQPYSILPYVVGGHWSRDGVSATTGTSESRRISNRVIGGN